MSTVKDEARRLIDELPDQATRDDVMYEIYIRQKVDAGLKAEDEGRLLTHEDVRNRFRVPGFPGFGRLKTRWLVE